MDFMEVHAECPHCQKKVLVIISKKEMKNALKRLKRGELNVSAVCEIYVVSPARWKEFLKQMETREP